MSYNTKYKLAVCLLFGALLTTCAQAYSQGVVFSEQRIVMNDNSIHTLQVCNPNDEPQTLMLMLENWKMEEDGSLNPINDSIPFAHSLKQNIRIYPRSINLLPRECQEVQLQVRNTQSMADGEYRSHLRFMPQDSNQTEESQEGDLKMKIIFQVSPVIPIIYRKNAEKGQYSITDAYISKNGQEQHELNFMLTKTATSSAYGTILVEGVVNGSNTVLNKSAGNAIYTEVGKKRMSIDLPVSEVDIDSDNSINLTISFIDGEDAARKTVLASKNIMLKLPD